MRWRTVILDPDNWALGEHPVKEIMLWSIQDRPWYNLRTYNIEKELRFPNQLKTHSWTSVEVSPVITIPDEVIKESHLMSSRMRFFTELHGRLQVSMENLGIANAQWNLLNLHEYLISLGLIKGKCPADAKIQYENKMRLLQDLNEIKETTIEMVLDAVTPDEFMAAKVYMERRFLTNILL